MKITNNNLYNLYNNNISQKHSFDISKNSSKFDTIEINSDMSISDKKFIGEVSSKISKDVRIGNSNQKIDDIKKQIEEGTYEIDINNIVKKMMLR